MKMTEKEKEIFEEHFSVHESEYANGLFYELEAWTAGGVDMIITLSAEDDKTITQQFKEYADSFDIDSEIDVYRQDSRYRSAFTIRESVADFEGWVGLINDVVAELAQQ